MPGIDESVRLSHMQEGLLFHHLYSGSDGVYVDQIICRLPERLDPVAFRRAWTDVARRHPQLRAAYRWTDLDRPIQDIHEDVAVPFEWHDWSHVPAEQQEALLAARLRADRLQGFDLGAPPLMRVTVFQLGEVDHRCVWTFHLSVADGESCAIVLREVLDRHEAYGRGAEPSAAPPCARRYRDFVAWLERGDRAGHEAFWRDALKGFRAATPVPVPTLGTPSDGTGDARAVHALRLSAATSEALYALARTHQLTPGTLVLGAWGLLLARYSGEDDVVFGNVRGGRRGTVEDAGSIVGLFINTVPVRATIEPDLPVLTWLAKLRSQLVAQRPHEHAALVDVQAWSELPPRTALFETLVIVEPVSLASRLRAIGERWAARDFELIAKTAYPLVLYASTERELTLHLVYDPRRHDGAAVARLLRHLEALLAGMVEDPMRQVSSLPLLTAAEHRQALVEWNATRRTLPEVQTIHGQFEAQCARTPDAVAVVCGGHELTYRELDVRADRLADQLCRLGVGPEVLVGICVERSIDMVIGLLGILKAGGAYVPLDPAYPRARLQLMLEDAKVPVLVTQAHLAARLPTHSARVLCLDTMADEGPAVRRDDRAGDAGPANLAYVIYTSGSTGRPKGVMVEHRNVVNLFVGMDDRLGGDGPGTWLATTSLSFDISVLELLWTLSRGHTVVIHDRGEVSAPGDGRASRRGMAMSLFYFAADDGGRAEDRYRLLLEGARFADRHGFQAVWTPERHFHEFGGLYPNPAVTGAAVASITERVQIRAGSVVLPLHSPIRVAEEWALVDNLSRGRVGISVASGWRRDDFAIAPQNYADRKALLFRQIETVRRLWRGEAVEFPGPEGRPVSVRTLPRPIQPELPLWVTTAGDVESYRLAGEAGTNVLTHLLGQSTEDLARKIAVYRAAWRDAGHDPRRGQVTLMLHTFVGASDEAVRETVRAPMIEYLRSSASLIKGFASTVPLFKNRSAALAGEAGDAFEQLSPDDLQLLLDHAFERYFETSGLFGTPETCLRMLDRLAAIDVDEVACLIDFGVAPDVVLDHLPLLDVVREAAARQPGTASAAPLLPAPGGPHRISHLQCTPSLATLALSDPEARATLGTLRTLLIGGEACSPALAAELSAVVPGEILNMYGPTETTIWSSTHRVNGSAGSVPIGRPIANTELYILDPWRQPVPVGVPGELYIGGAGVTRGYLDRPELTAERFVANPFASPLSPRLYRTGDLARYRQDGAVEFLGRVDQQVKVRGHRIELGEIESALREVPGVRDAVVAVREDRPGDRRIVAYVVPGGTPGPSADDLRRRLEERLPSVMVPSAFVPLAAIPLTPNGKVDRNALAAPEASGREARPVYVAPVSELERVVAGIWESVLGLPKVGTQDNFFDLGGHSLLTVQVHGRIRAATGRSVPLTDLFRFPTVRALAVHLSDDSGEERGLEQSRERGEARRHALAGRWARRSARG